MAFTNTNEQSELARLKSLMADPRYWRDQEPEFVAQVRAGFAALSEGASKDDTPLAPTFAVAPASRIDDQTHAANRREVDALLKSSTDGLFPTLHAETLRDGGAVVGYHDFLAQLAAKDPARAQNLHAKVCGHLGETPEVLRRAAAVVQDQGRNGDTLLAHISPEEAAHLKAHGGVGSRNPATGLLEFYYGMGSDAAADIGDTFGDPAWGTAQDWGEKDTAKANVPGMSPGERKARTGSPTGKITTGSGTATPTLQQKATPPKPTPKPEPKPISQPAKSLLEPEGEARKSLADRQAEQAARDRAKAARDAQRGRINADRMGQRQNTPAASKWGYSDFVNTGRKAAKAAQNQMDARIEYQKSKLAGDREIVEYSTNARTSVNGIRDDLLALSDEKFDLNLELSEKKGQLQNLRDNKSALESDRNFNQMVAIGLTALGGRAGGAIAEVVSNVENDQIDTAIAKLDRDISNLENEIEAKSQRSQEIDYKTNNLRENKAQLQDYLDRHSKVSKE